VRFAESLIERREGSMLEVGFPLELDRPDDGYQHPGHQQDPRVRASQSHARGGREDSDARDRALLKDLHASTPFWNFASSHLSLDGLADLHEGVSRKAK
jgi:hypothetical protein